MRPSPGLSDGDKVWKLNRCIYGLKQSVNELYGLFAIFLTSKDFTTLHQDPCIFIHNKFESFISLYVDDIAIFSTDSPHLTTLIKDLKTAFEISDLGEAWFLLGLHIRYTSYGIALTQERYVTTILSRFGIANSKTVSIPLPKGITLRKGITEQPKEQVTTYQSMIGSLMYLVTGTTPDLAYTISLLGQFSSCPTDEPIKAAKHVFWYVNGTWNLGLFYVYTTTNAIDLCVDADFAGCHDTRRSTSGYIVLFNNCCVSWLSEKQASVGKSTTEAQFVAMSYGTRHIWWLLKGLTDLHLHVPISMQADNTCANFLAVNHLSTVKTKHIAVDYFITRESMEDNLFVLAKVESVNKLADICTKILANAAHQRMATLLGCR